MQLAHAERPIPSRRRLLRSVALFAGIFLAINLTVVWWVEQRWGPDRERFLVGLLVALVIGLMVRRFIRIPIPAVRGVQGRQQADRARDKAARIGQVPGSPSLRAGAASRSCEDVDGAAFAVGLGLTGVLGLVLWPHLWWTAVFIAFVLVALGPAARTRRAWAYLRLYESTAHPG
ncbi:hypothetical protein [Kocuria rosea]|uniref:Uncharacterized protein n=1 Tax=Kocuria rosea TaxID=1275 RepID=A0A4R5YE31_KOCRO|nr:hypothetical protein [Kocuria rosea]TDL43035.1 hypothetical protein E2R59_09445 [Kocuria rosea]